MPLRRCILVLASLLPLTSAGAAEPGLSLRADDLRVASVAYRIARSGAPYCADPFPLTGMLLHHLAEYEPKDQPLQIEQYRLDRGPGVLAVVEGSPAARAGLLPGDVLLSVNGLALPDPTAIAAATDRRAARRGIGESETRLEEELRKGPADLVVLRDGVELRLGLAAERGCAVRARLARSDQRNAFADGRYVIVTTRLLDFVPSDDELAFIIGHEASHNLLNHKTRLDAQRVPTGMFKSFGKNASRIRATEEEADRLGLRLAWAAGYDPTAALAFWQRYYAKHDTPLQIFRTHPSLGARAKLMRETVAELEREPRPGAAAAASQ